MPNHSNDHHPADMRLVEIRHLRTKAGDLGRMIEKMKADPSPTDEHQADLISKEATLADMRARLSYLAKASRTPL